MSGHTHHSFGWSDDTIASDWPPLNDAEVHALLQDYPALSGETQITWRSPRPFSAAARVHTGAGDVFVKRHHQRVRTPQALLEEHAFIAHLRAHGLPIPVVLAAADGRTASARGDWVYEVHAIAHGVDLYRDVASWTPLTDLAHARSAGRMLARLHRAAADYHAPQRSTQQLVARDDLLRAPDLVAAMQTQLALRPALAEFLHDRNWQPALAPLAQRHRTLQPQLVTLSRLWTHGDWHASNLCWNRREAQAEVSAIFDFGLCAPTFALYDLATAIERNAVAWLHLDASTRAAFPHTARALIAGYCDLLPLALGQRTLLAELLPLVHLDFALSEVEYFHAILRAPNEAELAWSTFLIGHAQWFDTAPGRAFQAAIRG